MTSRFKEYISRPELRTNPTRTVVRRSYYEAMCRIAPARLKRLHASQLRYTDYTIRAPLTESVGKSLFLYGVYEPLTSAVFASLLEEGDAAVDVGAHYGDYALIAAARVGASGAVYAFEPQDEIRSILTENLLANGVGHAKVFDCALADQAGWARLYVPSDPTHTGGASLSQASVGAAQWYAEVPLRRLDDVVAEADMARVSAIKIDVEGSEAAVLNGAAALLDRSRPAIVFEVNGLSTDGRYECDAFSVLLAAGYRLYGMLPAAGGFTLEPASVGADPARFREPWLALNMLAVAPGSSAETRLKARGALV